MSMFHFYVYNVIMSLHTFSLMLSSHILPCIQCCLFAHLALHLSSSYYICHIPSSSTSHKWYPSYVQQITSLPISIFLDWSATYVMHYTWSRKVLTINTFIEHSKDIWDSQVLCLSSMKCILGGKSKHLWLSMRIVCLFCSHPLTGS